MGEERSCEQCGMAFLPRREHARFCSPRCRVAWNRGHAAGADAGESALEWSLIAMRDATGRLARCNVLDRPRASAAIGEAVWWVTIVDATMVRHHLEVYDRVAATYPAAEWRLTEATLAGLRFVRNRMGDDVDHVDFIEAAGRRSGQGGIRATAWRWRPMDQPAIASLPSRAGGWEKSRYQDYQAQLAGHPVGEVFGRATTFLCRAAAAAVSPASAAATR